MEKLSIVKKHKSSLKELNFTEIICFELILNSTFFR